MIRLRTLLGDYAMTASLKQGGLASPDVAFDFAAVTPPSAAFKQTVRDVAFDVSELSIVTFLMAKAAGRPLVLLPAVVLSRFQHPFIVYNAERGELRPGDLNGRRIGLRCYTVTTATWLRGVLADDHGLDIDSVRWVALEEPHVAEYRDPPNVEPAPGRDLVGMLLDGELDAAILTSTALPDPRLKRLFPDPDAAAREWHARNKALQINHMVVVTEDLSRSNPGAVREVYRLLCESKRAAGLPAPGAIDANPCGLESNRRNLEAAIDCVYRQRLIPVRYSVDELFDETTRNLDHSGRST